MFKNILIMIIATGGLILLFSSLENKPLKKIVVVDDNQEVVVETPLEQSRSCFYKESESFIDSELLDISSLELNFSGKNVKGELKIFPAQMDGNFGSFQGAITSDDLQTSQKIIDVIWRSESEGTTTPRELRILLSGNLVKVGFGELIDRGDGVYVYIDKENIETWHELSQIDCSSVEEKGIITQYLADNMPSIIPHDAVLGGTFYLLSARIDPESKSGTFKYEDGHIAGSATFSYEISGGAEILIKNVITSEY